MDTSPSTATEKKDKMEGSSFTDLLKKPSASDMRGKMFFNSLSKPTAGSEPNVQLSVGRDLSQNESRSRRCSVRGQRGSEQD